MADLLIKATDTVDLDPVSDATSCFKRGDVVAIKPTGWHWGVAEGPPTFTVVTLLAPDGTSLWSAPKGWKPGDPIAEVPKVLDPYIQPRVDAFTAEVVGLRTYSFSQPNAKTATFDPVLFIRKPDTATKKSTAVG